MKRRYPRLPGPRFAVHEDHVERCYVCWPPGPRLAGLVGNEPGLAYNLDAWIPGAKENGTPSFFGIDRTLYPQP